MPRGKPPVKRGFIEFVKVYTTRRGHVRFKTVITVPAPLGSEELRETICEAAIAGAAESTIATGKPSKTVKLIVQRGERRIATIDVDVSSDKPVITKLNFRESPLSQLFRELKAQDHSTGELNLSMLDPVKPYGVIEEYPVTRLFEREEVIGAAPLQPKPRERTPYLHGCDRLSLLAEWAWFTTRHLHLSYSS
jgi:hypothetical protein